MLSKTIKEIRIQKGYSQERLAEETGLSLRTIQRVENGETEPRGDTILRLAKALGVTTDDIFEYEQNDDTSFLVLLNLSALSFMLFPLLGVILPLVLWVTKKEKVKNANKVGKEVLNFQITWTLLLFGSVAFFMIWDYSWLVMLIGTPIYYLNKIHISFPIIISALFLYNLIMVTVNSIWVGQEKELWYKPKINFIN